MIWRVCDGKGAILMRELWFSEGLCGDFDGEILNTHVKITVLCPLKLKLSKNNDYFYII